MNEAMKQLGLSHAQRRHVYLVADYTAAHEECDWGHAFIAALRSAIATPAAVLNRPQGPEEE